MPYSNLWARKEQEHLHNNYNSSFCCDWMCVRTWRKPWRCWTEKKKQKEHNAETKASPSQEPRDVRAARVIFSQMTSTQSESQQWHCHGQKETWELNTGETTEAVAALRGNCYEQFTLSRRFETWRDLLELFIVEVPTMLNLKQLHRDLPRILGRTKKFKGRLQVHFELQYRETWKSE